MNSPASSPSITNPTTATSPNDEDRNFSSDIGSDDSSGSYWYLKQLWLYG